MNINYDILSYGQLTVSKFINKQKTYIYVINYET